MFNVSDYLKKFSKIHNNHFALRVFIDESFLNVCELKSIKYEVKKGIIKLNEPAQIKSVVFMKKQQILNEIKNRSGVNILDIR